MKEESLATRLGRLRFRSWRRGFRELDLILGPWADAHIHELNEDELVAYEALLTAPDWDVYYWITQGREPDFPHSESLLAKLTYFVENSKN